MRARAAERGRTARLCAALGACAAVALVAGCTTSGPAGSSKGGAPRLHATAALYPTKGNVAIGTVLFSEEDGKVIVLVDMHGLPPGLHGFHLHEKGDCSAPDAMSAGGHFNPDGDPHGPQSGPHHAGDFPALKADESGVAKAMFTVSGLTVSAGPHSVVGKALIVHRDPDDYTTQPTGNSGARIACGVVALR
jgi:superoxide dismutase, Cu-Zn family